MSYQPEERYWTDYLRIALPVAGLLILLGVFWYWAGELIGGGNDDGPAATEIALGEVSIAASPPAVAATATPATIAPTPGTAPPPTPSAPAAAVNPTAIPSSAAAEAPEQEATEPANPSESDEPATEPLFPLYDEGATVETTEAANLREGPSTATDPVAELEAGTELTIRGAFEDDAEGGEFDWWPVTTTTGAQGYVREDLLQAQD